MNSLADKQSEALYEPILIEQELDSSSIQSAIDLFDIYRQKGVISNCQFQDVRWQLHDEYSNVGIRFNFSQLLYKRKWEQIFGIPFTQFIQYQKTYIILTLGKRVLITLQNIVNDMKMLLKNVFSDDLDTYPKYKLPYHITEFLSMLPCVDSDRRDEVINYIEELVDINFKEYPINRRSLSQFQSYFRFDKLLNEYWGENISTENRLFFYPVYLWWKITGVIPLRPREFLLTPRACLITDVNGKTQIKLRRNKLKGSGGKVHYNISQDYVEVLYAIPDSLKEEIERYIDLTEIYEANDLDTLFRTDPHFAKFRQPRHKNNRFYTYTNLSCCLRLFYYEILSKMLHFQVIKGSGTTEYTLGDNDIEYIYLGDTRHISMINIIAEGGTPTMAMLLAGHANIDISSHYYANLSNMIECRTYMKYKSMLEENSEYILGSNYYPSSKIEQINTYVELENYGRCYSIAFANSDISDCKKVVGDNGEIGYCYNCPYYRKNHMSYFLDNDDIYKSKIDKELQFFINSLEKYRKNMGFEEEVKSAYMRLEASSNQYESYYMQKLVKNWEEERNSNHGASKENQ